MNHRPTDESTLDVDRGPAHFASLLHLVVAADDGRAFGASELTRRFDTAFNALREEVTHGHPHGLPAETPEQLRLRLL